MNQTRLLGMDDDMAYHILAQQMEAYHAIHCAEDGHRCGGCPVITVEQPDELDIRFPAE